ncbi:uncharacterized protein RJT21DRAFT_119986 [Scheffersomyces amazonensis]|uniref:uncharacterized protein n=1 Tax=Scheffersomyces amazonensis TaxID=1078765 RepID=UPI00315D2EAF
MSRFIQVVRVSPVRSASTLGINSRRFFASKFGTEITPSPPRLPKEEQEEFEKLQSIANSQIAIEEYNDQIKASGTHSSEAPTLITNPPKLSSDIGSFQTLKTIPEFEGEVNPKTGEVGGPKQDPLRHSNEWAFNGRVTDF